MGRVGAGIALGFGIALAGVSSSLAARGQGQLTVDVADLDTSKANRIILENMLDRGGVVTLPAGTIYLDRALALKPEHSGVTIAGAGPQSILRNVHDTVSFWTSPTIVAQGGGLGYADEMTHDDERRVTIEDGADLRPYDSGTLVYGFRWDGYTNADRAGMLATRRRIVRQVGVRSFLLDGPIDPRCNKLKWLDAAPIRGPAEGDSAVTLENGDDLARFPPGAPVFISDGPTLANEARGEFRRVAAVDPATRTVRLDRPLRSSYAAASALVRVKPVQNVTLRDFTVGRPRHPRAVASCFKFCTDWRMERVHPEWVFTIGGSSKFTLKDCEAKEAIEFNTCHDMQIEGGRYRSLYLEEGCADVSAVDCLLGPAQINGVMSVVGCERVRLSRVRIFGSANMPISLMGRENVLESVTVAESKQPSVNCYICGRRTRTTDLKSDVPVVFTDGLEQRVESVTAPTVFLGWVDKTRSGGVARGLQTPSVQVKTPDWKVEPLNPGQ